MENFNTAAAAPPPLSPPPAHPPPAPAPPASPPPSKELVFCRDLLNN